jgi:hypothetical protein
MGQMMEQTKPFPASQPESTEGPPASNERPRLRRSAAVRVQANGIANGIANGRFTK